MTAEAKLADARIANARAALAEKIADEHAIAARVTASEIAVHRAENVLAATKASAAQVEARADAARTAQARQLRRLIEAGNATHVSTRSTDVAVDLVSAREGVAIAQEALTGLQRDLEDLRERGSRAKGAIVQAAFRVLEAEAESVADELVKINARRAKLVATLTGYRNSCSFTFINGQRVAPQFSERARALLDPPQPEVVFQRLDPTFLATRSWESLRAALMSDATAVFVETEPCGVAFIGDRPQLETGGLSNLHPPAPSLETAA